MMGIGRGLLTVKAFALCAVVAFGAGASLQAQQAVQPQAGQGTSSVQTLGNVGASGSTPATGSSQVVGQPQAGSQPIDETTLSLDAQAATANKAAKAAGPDTFVYFLRMLLVLALVLGVMYLVFTLMRRLARPRNATDSPIRVLASTSLGTGKAVHLVELGGKAWLLGASEQGLTLITEIDDRELLDGIELEAATRKPAGGDFGGILARLLRGGRPVKIPLAEGDQEAPDGRWIAKRSGRLGKFNEGDRP